MGKLVFPVHQVNNYVKNLLDKDPILRRIWIRGEISNFQLHSSGHMYFTLKDEQGRIRCVFFKYHSHNLDFTPENGMKVVMRGNVSIYSKDGQYQFYVEHIEKDGLGELHIALEALKKKLKEEGLFNLEYKKPLPPFPEKVGIITSGTGAAVQDIIKVIKKRNPNMNILVIPVLVQGEGAKDQISAAITYAGGRQDIDVLIVGRGGGSIEELWAFNEEKVARAIFSSSIPIISAVGHETDLTISDLVADVRAPTPSAAGEIVAQDISHIRQSLAGLDKRLQQAIDSSFSLKTNRWERTANSYVIKYPHRLLSIYEQQLDYSLEKLHGASTVNLNKKEEQLLRCIASLDALNPLRVLMRGFSVVTKKETGQIVMSVDQLQVGDFAEIRMKDGIANCSITQIEKE